MIKNILHFKKRRVGLLFITLVLLSSFIIPVGKAFAIPDVRFYSTNLITAYDPDSCDPKSAGSGASSSDSGKTIGDDNYEKGLRFYVSKGLTLAQAAGILGNFKQESRMNPAIKQTPSGGTAVTASYTLEPGVGFGIAQWTSGGRQNKLTTYAKEQGLSIIDLGMQLGYSWKELQTDYPKTLTALKETTTADKAARVFHDGYESSSDSEDMLKKRATNAENIYQSYKSKVPDNSSTKQTTQVCTGNGKASAFVDGFTIYTQQDPQWADVWYGGPSNPHSDKHGTVAGAGCGPSSMAMVITALTKQTVTPAQTATYGRANGTVYNLPDGSAGGSKHNLEIIGDHWNLAYAQVDKSVAAINEGLRAGGLVVMSGQGTAPFTDKGHFVTIRAVNANGKWLLGDSNGKVGVENSKKEWDPADIVNRMGDYHFLFKSKANANLTKTLN